jgi:hypothetical protein
MAALTLRQDGKERGEENSTAGTTNCGAAFNARSRK